MVAVKTIKNNIWLINSQKKSNKAINFINSKNYDIINAEIYQYYNNKI